MKMGRYLYRDYEYYFATKYIGIIRSKQSIIKTDARMNANKLGL
jgi:hypothetical protein